MAHVSFAPTQEDIFTALRAFLTDILPTGTPIVQAQTNRVPEPKDGNFVIMTPLRLPRLATNIDTFVDAVFTATILSRTLTVSAIEYGEIKVGSIILGTGVAANTVVDLLGTGTGGTGTYSVSPVQAIVTPQTMAAGYGEYLQKAEAVFQLDCHGELGGDYAQTISTLFRDGYATTFFAALGSTIAPLYADDPRQMPFTNEQKQTETRWIVEAHMQVDQTVTVQGQPFADQIDVGIIEVDTTYPPE